MTTGSRCVTAKLLYVILATLQHLLHGSNKYVSVLRPTRLIWLSSFINFYTVLWILTLCDEIYMHQSSTPIAIVHKRKDQWLGAGSRNSCKKQMVDGYCIADRGSHMGGVSAMATFNVMVIQTKGDCVRRRTS